MDVVSGMKRHIHSVSSWEWVVIDDDGQRGSSLSDADVGASGKSVVEKLGQFVTFYVYFCSQLYSDHECSPYIQYI